MLFKTHISIICIESPPAPFSISLYLNPLSVYWIIAYLIARVSSKSPLLSCSHLSDGHMFALSFGR